MNEFIVRDAEGRTLAIFHVDGEIASHLEGATVTVGEPNGAPRYTATFGLTNTAEEQRQRHRDAAKAAAQAR